MERHVLVIRCLHLILFVAWHVDAVHRNVKEDMSRLDSEFDRKVKCTYDGFVWLCRGEELLVVPHNLTSASKEMSLKIRDAGIKVLYKDSLTPYVRILRRLYLVNIPEFCIIESGIFQNTTALQTIYISHAPKLTFIDDEVFNVHLPHLKEIRIIRAALLALPYFGKLVIGKNPLKMIDFENNMIQIIKTASIKIRSEKLLLNYNKIKSVKSMAFNGSQIAELSLKGNIALTSMDGDAFMGLENIRVLDLSQTSIVALPTDGLSKLEVLKISDTPTLKVVPLVTYFGKKFKAIMTYPYHCCAFKFPDKHDPETYKKEMKTLIKKMACPQSLTHVDIGIAIRSNGTTPRPTRIDCGKMTPYKNDIVCLPAPDAFNPCEDIMGSWGLRIAVWFVALSTIVGNLAVLVVLVSTRIDMTVPKFLMCNLAWADLCMGIYLMLIATMDVLSIGEYFNYAIDWQHGLGCQIAGFLSVFSTELSIFTLTVITIERWYTITYAIHLNRRLNLETSATIMVVGWIYACVMAALPLADISSYARTSICLPLTYRNNNDLLYLTTLLIFYGLTFLVIVVCYGRMYSSVRGSRKEATPMTRFDMTVAKRMALLVFMDFVCWAPIAFFAVTALAAEPLISVTKTKILLVFVYPLNSCANPCLYALLTQQYRSDFFALLARYGMCNNRAASYKGVMNGFPSGERMNNMRGDRNQGTMDTRQHNSSALTTTVLLSADLSNHKEKTYNNCKNPQAVINDCQVNYVHVQRRFRI